MTPLEGLVARLAADGELPAFVIDLDELEGHVAAVRAALPEDVELHYAAKANAEAPVLRVLGRHVDGIEVASGGELAHVRSVLPRIDLAFGGPGKTQAELAAAVEAGAVVHVEGVHELRVLTRVCERLETAADVLLRLNPPLEVPDAKLRMGGPSPFGLDPEQAAACLPLVGTEHVGLAGVHTHLASGLDAEAQLALATATLDWVTAWAGEHGQEIGHVTLGGGMAVDYGAPDERFDWQRFGDGLGALLDRGYRLRLEPGRSLTAYAGRYAARVLDVRPSHRRWFAVVEGGTHHLRTPAARGHDQPFHVLPVELWEGPDPRPELGGDRVTVVGVLCTPKDVLARDVPCGPLRAGDVAVFGMAGAYGWNISHHEFLMHAPPSFHYFQTRWVHE